MLFLSNSWINLKSPETLEQIDHYIKYIIILKVKHLENYFKHVYIRCNHFIKDELISDEDLIKMIEF